jgi:glucose/arabinose dehydrogenase
VNRATAGTSPAEWPDGLTERTADGVTLRLDKVAEGLDDAVDAAFTPDGRMFIAERAGRVRIVQGGRLQREDALTAEDPDARLLSIAIDPDFERSRFVFVVQATSTGGGDLFRLARYRELNGTLAQRATLIEVAAPPIPDATAVLRAGPGGRLYLAVGAADSPGTLLRLNLDGTMPRDQAGSSPAVAQGVQSPTGLAADPGSGLVWIADEQDGQAHLSGVALTGRPLRAVVRARHPLTRGGGSLAFYAGAALPGFENTLLLASASGRHIERIRFSREQPERIAGSDTLLQDAVGPIQVVAVSPDGAIYFCAGPAVGRLSAP